MALTRAQLLMGDGNFGTVLTGQAQGVRPGGAGITIDANGVISVDASSAIGLMKLNNPSAYNSYVWPGAPIANKFLKTDGAGLLSWSDVSGLAVVTVQGQPAPVPADIGELWFDCSTGTLNVYQNCVGSPSPNWFNISQPGLPVLPSNTSAAPAFTGGNGTLATPYDCTVTTTGAGSTVYVINTVTIVGLAPFQYVPIIDLNAVTNGGRFSFSNNYANAGGSLTFQTIFTDAPVSPPATSYTAAIKVGYGTVYISAVVNVVSALSTTSGSISGTPSVGNVLTYTTGVASGGSSPYTYAWVWQRDGVTIPGATLPTYTLVTADVNKNITVLLTATDSALATATATTAAVGPVTTAPFPIPVWNPVPSTGLDSIPGGQSAAYNGTATSITTTGCIQASVNGGPYSTGTQPISSGQTLATRWSVAALCGGAASGTAITGSITDGTYTKQYNITVNRLPAAFTFSAVNNAPLSSVQQSNSISITGINTTSYVTYGAASTGSSIQGSIDGGTTWNNIPASGTTFPVSNSDNLLVRLTTNGTASSTNTAVINIGDGDNVQKTTSTFTVTNTSSATFPNLPPSLVAGPTNIPQTVSGTWADGSTSVTSTGCIQISLDNVTFNQGPLSVSNGVTLYERWNPTGASCGAANSGTTITGTLTNGTFTNSYSLTLDRTPSAITYTAVTNAALSSVQTSNTQTISGTNAPAYLTYDATSTGDSATYFAIINGGSPVAIPSAPSSAVEVPPGATLELRQTAAGTITTTRNLVVNLGNSDGTAATQATFSVQTTNTATIPGLTLTPAGGPNASPATVSIAGESLYGTATGTWPATSLTITGTGSLVFNKNGGANTQAATAFVSGNTINLSWDPAAVASAADLAVLTGTITGGGYTNTYSYTVDKDPSFSLSTISGATINTPYDTGTFTPTAFNSPVALTYTAGANTLTSVTASINGAGAVSVPTSGSTLLVNPGDTVRIFGTTGGSTGTTYSISVNLGVASQTWNVVVPAPVPSVTTPNIISPSFGASGVNPAVNTPAAISVIASNYSSSNGAGSHASSDWQLSTDSAFSTIVYQSLADTSNLTTWSIPQANVNTSTTYYIRVRYTSNPTVTTSSYGTSQFTTASSFIPAIGGALGGGFFGGQINDGGTIYNLIVAPRQSGSLNGQYGGNTPNGIQWKNADTADGAVADNLVYGKPATDALASANYFMFDWCKNSPSGPNGGGGIGGFTDWYIPAKNELEVLYYFLKPTTTSNVTFPAGNGSNPNAVSPEPVSTAYTASSPGQTSAFAFRVGNSQEFASASFSDSYWAATQASGGVSGVIQYFDSGNQNSNGKSQYYNARAIRRVSA